MKTFRLLAFALIVILSVCKASVAHADGWIPIVENDNCVISICETVNHTEDYGDPMWQSWIMLEELSPSKAQEFKENLGLDGTPSTIRFTMIADENLEYIAAVEMDIWGSYGAGVLKSVHLDEGEVYAAYLLRNEDTDIPEIFLKVSELEPDDYNLIWIEYLRETIGR